MATPIGYQLTLKDPDTGKDFSIIFEQQERANLFGAKWFLYSSLDKVDSTTQKRRVAILVVEFLEGLQEMISLASDRASVQPSNQKQQDPSVDESKKNAAYGGRSRALQTTVSAQKYTIAAYSIEHSPIPACIQAVSKIERLRNKYFPNSTKDDLKDWLNQNRLRG